MLNFVWYTIWYNCSSSQDDVILVNCEIAGFCYLCKLKLVPYAPPIYVQHNVHNMLLVVKE